MAIDNEARRARAALLRAAAAIGASVTAEQSGRLYELRVMAPRGTHWRDGAHELVDTMNAGPWSYADLFTGALDRMALGTEPCGADCEWWPSLHDGE